MACLGAAQASAELVLQGCFVENEAADKEKPGHVRCFVEIRVKMVVSPLQTDGHEARVSTRVMEKSRNPVSWGFCFSAGRPLPKVALKKGPGRRVETYLCKMISRELLSLSQSSSMRDDFTKELSISLVTCVREVFDGHEILRSAMQGWSVEM